MGIRIDALMGGIASRDHVVPAMDGGQTIKLSIGQILDLLIDAAPGALDTLNELAAALGDDANFATTVTNALAGKLASDGSNVGNDAAKTAFLAAVGIDTSGAAGDLFFRSATGLLAKLPKGTAGQVLKQNAALTAPEWGGGVEIVGNAIRTATNIPSLIIPDLGDFPRLRVSGKLTVASDNVNIQVRTSTDNGSTFAASSSDYAGLAENIIGATRSSAPYSGAGGTGHFMTFSTGVGNAANEALSFTLDVFDFNQAAYCTIKSEAFYSDASGAANIVKVGGVRANASARNALQIIASSGNIASISYTVEGFR